MLTLQLWHSCLVRCLRQNEAGSYRARVWGVVARRGCTARPWPAVPAPRNGDLGCSVKPARGHGCWLALRQRHALTIVRSALPDTAKFGNRPLLTDSEIEKQYATVYKRAQKRMDSNADINLVRVRRVSWLWLPAVGIGACRRRPGVRG